MSGFQVFPAPAVTATANLPTAKAIINASSTTGFTPLSNLDSAMLMIGKDVVSGALTANTLATLLNVSGSGTLNLVAARTVDATSRTMRMRVTLDGTVAFDSTSTAMTATGKGMLAVGVMAQATPFPISLDNVTFTTSCLVEWASSITETGKFTATLVYHTN